MAGRTYSPDEALNSFCTWIVSHGGFINESLVIIPPDGDLQYGSRVLTTSALPPNSRLVTCPHTLAINYAKARSNFSPAFTESTTRHAALCLFLCAERLKGEDSLWWPYLRVLPREFDTPLYFSEEDMKYLRGCNLDVAEVEARRGAWKEELADALEALRKEGISTDAYTWELYLWSATIFSSRSFLGKLMNWESQRGLDEDGDDAPALFPLIDSLNHYPITRIIWQTGDSSLSIVSGEELTCGVEVFNNYGPKPNDELLMGYGFALPSNPFDAVLLRFSPSLTPSQQSLYDLQHPHPTPGLYHLTPRNHTPETPSIYPTALLNLFHILTALPHELSLLHSNPGPQATTLRNTLSTHSQLLLAVRQKLCKIPPTIPPPRSSKQASALHYREGQLAILTSAVQESAAVLKAAIASGKFVTLQSALLSSPTFASAVEACFGTSDPLELQDSQQDEIVLILYICHLHLITKLPSPPIASCSQQQQQQEEREEEEPQEAIKQLYADIFPSAADAAPETFGGEGWTEEILAWAMKTYMDHGVTIYPYEERGEEVLGVFGVCLEWHSSDSP